MNNEQADQSGDEVKRSKNYYSFPTIISGMEMPHSPRGDIPAPPKPTRRKHMSSGRSARRMERILRLRDKRKGRIVLCYATNGALKKARRKA